MGKTALEKLAARSIQQFERTEKRPNAHYEMKSAVLVDENNRKLDWNILGALTAAPMEQTITGASTIRLECEDSHHSLLNDPVFAKWMFRKKQVSTSSGKTYTARKITDSKKNTRYAEENEEEWVLPTRPIDLEVDGVWFRLSGFDLQETKLTLIFEDRLAAILREQVGSVVHASRGSMTRAQFIEHLCHLAEKAKASNRGKCKTFIPEAKIKQAVAIPTTTKATDLKKGANRSLGPNQGITVEGKPATAIQLQYLNELLEVCVEQKASGIVQVAMIYAAIGETRAGDNLSTSSAGAKGVLQSLHPPFDAPTQAKNFLLGNVDFQQGGAIKYSKSFPHATAPQIAVEVERPSIWPANSYASEENASLFLPEAEHIVQQYGATEGENGEQITTVPGNYEFQRGPYETSWDAIQRIASEVSWYAFVRENRLWYISGNFLMAQEARMLVEKGVHGVEWVNVHIDIGARDNLAEIQVKGRALPFTAISGEPVAVARVGPANGKWIVDTVLMDLLDRGDSITAKLLKPLPARPEPAANTTEEEKSGAQSGAGSGFGAGERDPSGTHAMPLESQYMSGQLGRTDEGVDIESCPDGKPVFSMTAGKCTAVASDSSGFGPNYPVIEITQGSRQGKCIYYGHVAKSLVKKGDNVYAGQPIAVMGHTGDASGLGHGHIEIGFSDSTGNPISHAKGTGHTGPEPSAATPSGDEMRAFIIWICSLFQVKAT